jgi:mediator of RNA polymerase II transcription subunit 31
MASESLAADDDKPLDDARAANRARFELELEFVQSLANPHYLYSLG